MAAVQHSREEQEDSLSLSTDRSPESDRGFLLATLLATGVNLAGRWNYLTTCWEADVLPDAPIPQIHFERVPDKAVWKMLTASLDVIPKHSASWQGWSNSTNFRYFLEWMLYGLHHAGQPIEPIEPAGCEGASERLRQAFDLTLMINAPYGLLR